MKGSIRSVVRLRARRRCEYCRLHESDQPLFSFQIEHIIAKKHRGTDELRNLAWSCLDCNAGKSSNLSGRDTESGRIVALFNPRRQRWRRHFRWNGPRLMGLTPCGRATIEVLNINSRRRIELRATLILASVFPPDEPF